MNKRVEIIASNVPSGIRSVYEVCCDHALITLKAFSYVNLSSAVVSDISDKSLNKARNYLRDYNVEYIVFDGIDENICTDLIIICGIGGRLMKRILDRYSGSAPLLLSPQLNQDLVRSTLMEKGYSLVKDFCFEADKKYYDLMYAVKGEMALDNMQLIFGRYYKEKNNSLKEKLIKRLSKVIKSNNENKINEIKEALKWQE